MAAQTRTAIDCYTAGIICAFPFGRAAIVAMLDEIHQDFQAQDTSDSNIYKLGKMQGHNVVVACLPGGQPTMSTATMTKDMLRTFKSLRFVLIVGIAGGAPSEEDDIRLGDVVVGQPDRTSGGVVQFHRCQTHPGFERTSTLNAPPPFLLSAVNSLKSDLESVDSQIKNYLSEMVAKYPKMRQQYSYLGADKDVLYTPDYSHRDEFSGEISHDLPRPKKRRKRNTDAPEIHFGTIGSSSELINDAQVRDHLRKELRVLCFETEATGLPAFPCLVIRGISHYSDSHINDQWQLYAAAVAAAFAKQLLPYVYVPKLEHERVVQSESELEQHPNIHAEMDTEISSDPGKWQYSIGTDNEHLEGDSISPGVKLGNASSDRIEYNKPFFLVPLFRNPQFVGRERALDHLGRMLTADSRNGTYSYPMVAIYGLGGIGKTQLVNEFIHLEKTRSPSQSIFWLSAQSIEALELSYISIGRLISSKREGAFNTNKPTSQQVIAWISSNLNGNWLLVLDNLDDTSINIHKLLPRKGDGKVVITTRDREIIGKVAQSGIYLQEMNSLDGQRLFLRALRGKGLHTAAEDKPWQHPEYHELQQIVRELQGFPLVLSQAAAFVRENTPKSFKEYLDYLKPRTEDRELLLKFKETYPTYPESIMTALETTLKFISQHHSQAAEILQILGFLHHSEIEEALLEKHFGPQKTRPVMPVKVWLHQTYIAVPPEFISETTCLSGDAKFRQAIEVLISFSLITRTISLDGRTVLNVHPLVHEWLRVRLHQQPAIQIRYTILAMKLLYYSFPFEYLLKIGGHPLAQGEPTPVFIERLLPHINSSILNLQQYHENTREVPLECATLIAGYLFLVSWKLQFPYLFDKDFILASKVLSTIHHKVHGANQVWISLLGLVMSWSLNEKSIESYDRTLSRISLLLSNSAIRKSLHTEQIPFLLIVLSAIFFITNERLRYPEDLLHPGYQKLQMSKRLATGFRPFRISAKSKFVLPIKTSSPLPDLEQSVLDVLRVFRRGLKFSAEDRQYNIVVEMLFDHHCLMNLSPKTIRLANIGLQHFNHKADFLNTQIEMLLDGQNIQDPSQIAMLYDFALSLSEDYAARWHGDISSSDKGSEDSFDLSVAASTLGKPSRSYMPREVTTDPAVVGSAIASAFAYIWTNSGTVCESLIQGPHQKTQDHDIFGMTQLCSSCHGYVLFKRTMGLFSTYKMDSEIYLRPMDLQCTAIRILLIVGKVEDALVLLLYFLEYSIIKNKYSSPDFPPWAPFRSSDVMYLSIDQNADDNQGEANRRWYEKVQKSGKVLQIELSKEPEVSTDNSQATRGVRSYDLVDFENIPELKNIDLFDLLVQTLSRLDILPDIPPGVNSSDNEASGGSVLSAVQRKWTQRIELVRGTHDQQVKVVGPIRLLLDLCERLIEPPYLGHLDSPDTSSTEEPSTSTIIYNQLQDDWYGNAEISRFHDQLKLDKNLLSLDAYDDDLLMMDDL